jgi:hypothetical protein
MLTSETESFFLGVGGIPRGESLEEPFVVFLGDENEEGLIG